MSEGILPDGLPVKRVHLVYALAFVAVVVAICFVIDLWVVTSIAVEVEAKSGESDWSRTLSIFRSIIENVMACAIAASILALIARWIISIIDPQDRVIEVSPTSITSRLNLNAHNTREYIFIGNTATFVTAAILPTLVDIAGESKVSRKIELHIIDPSDAVSVDSYVKFKNQLSQHTDGVASRITASWTNPQFVKKVETDREVKAKILTSVYLAAFASVQVQMSVSVYLRRSFTLFRADMSDKEVVLTQESSTEPGVAFSNLGVFYGWYHKEANAQRLQGININLEGKKRELIDLKLANPRSSKAIISSSVTELFQLIPELSIFSGDSDLIDLVAQKISHPKHSY